MVMPMSHESAENREAFEVAPVRQSAQLVERIFTGWRFPMKWATEDRSHSVWDSLTDGDYVVRISPDGNLSLEISNTPRCREDARRIINSFRDELPDRTVQVTEIEGGPIDLSIPEPPPAPSDDSEQSPPGTAPLDRQHLEYNPRTGTWHGSPRS